MSDRPSISANTELGVVYYRRFPTVHAFNMLSVEEVLNNQENDHKYPSSIDSASYFVPVNAPSPEKLKINLVPSHQLDRLWEYQGDSNKFLALTSLAVGGVIGLVINLATAGFKVIDSSAIITGVSFFFISFVFFGFTFQAWQREKQLKDEILDMSFIPVEINFNNTKQVQENDKESH